MPIKVSLYPEPKLPNELKSGVDVVVYETHKRLAAHPDISLVAEPKKANVLAAHICWGGRQPADVIHCHGLYPTASWDLPKWTWEVNKRAIESIREARIVTVPSRWVGELFARDMGFWPEILPHGLDLSLWPDPKRTEIKPVVVWNKNRTTDVCAVKPVEDLAKAAPDFGFVSTFGEPQRNLQITGVIPHPEMRRLLYDVGGIYFSSTKETFGIGIIEALAAGLPVLAWRWGNAAELIQHRVNGYLVDPNDIEGSREGLQYILDNYLRMSEGAVRSARQYGWDGIIDKYVNVYALADKVGRSEQGEPLVSIIIPNYNYAHYIEQTIESVKAQTYKNLECIIVDDESTDGSVRTIKRSIEGDGRFQLLQPGKGYVASTRNAGAMKAKGRFLMFLDADDWLLPNAVDVLVKGIQRERSYGIVYGKLSLANEDGKILREVSPWPEQFDLAKQMARKNQVPACCLLRRTAFFRAGGFRSHVIPAEDAELWTRIVLLGFRARQVTEEPVYVYRLHGKSATDDIRGGHGDKEPNWLEWLSAPNGGPVPFACVAKPINLSHAIYPYDEPMVSFVTPVGNDHKKLLVDALESVASQTDSRWEMIVVDDTTEGGIENFGSIPYKSVYPYVRWLRNKKIGNVSAARNMGAAAARGKYLCFLDADDYLLRDFLKSTLLILKECTGDAAIVYTDWISHPEGKAHRANNWNLTKLLEQALFAVTFVHPKSAWKNIGGFDETVDLWEDWDYTIRLGLDGYRGIRVPHPLFVYRYDTGKRRELSLEREDELLKQIRGKYIRKTPKPRRG